MREYIVLGILVCGISTCFAASRRPPAGGAPFIWDVMSIESEHYTIHSDGSLSANIQVFIDGRKCQVRLDRLIPPKPVARDEFALIPLNVERHLAREYRTVGYISELTYTGHLDPFLVP